MADQTFILFLGSDRWCIRTQPPVVDPPTDIPFATDADQTAEDVGRALRTAGYNGGPIGICVASASCLSVSIDITDLPRNDSRAMLYRMEESLPLAAEAVVADFVVRQAKALGVCVRLDAIARLVTSLEAAGIMVQSITPTALAAAQSFASANPKDDGILLIREPLGAELEFANVMLIQTGLLTRWSLAPATLSDLKLQLDLLACESATLPPIHGIDLDPLLVEQLSAATGQTIKPLERNAISLACELATEVIRNGTKPWAEFRRDQFAAADPLRLHRKWIDLALVAGIAVILSIAIACLVRGHRYQDADQQNIRAMTAAFQKHFPSREIPIDMRAIVDAEYRRAMGAGNTAGLSQGSRSALITLHDVLIPLMAQDHVQISRMAFHESAFEITGRILSYEQLDALCKSARVDGMVVTPAQTRKDTDGTWTFTLQGSKPTVAAG